MGIFDGISGLIPGIGDEGDSGGGFLEGGAGMLVGALGIGAGMYDTYATNATNVEIAEKQMDFQVSQAELNRST